MMAIWLFLAGVAWIFVAIFLERVVFGGDLTFGSIDSLNKAYAWIALALAGGVLLILAAAAVHLKP